MTYNYVSRPGSIMGNMARERIPVSEIRERFKADAVLTSHCERLKDRAFYDVYCARVMKHKFRAVCVALRHRNRFQPQKSSASCATRPRCARFSASGATGGYTSFFIMSATCRQALPWR